MKEFEVKGARFQTHAFVGQEKALIDRKLSVVLAPVLGGAMGHLTQLEDIEKMDFSVLGNLIAQVLGNFSDKEYTDFISKILKNTIFILGDDAVQLDSWDSIDKAIEAVKMDGFYILIFKILRANELAFFLAIDSFIKKQNSSAE